MRLTDGITYIDGMRNPDQGIFLDGIMNLADRHSPNGVLTVNEMRTFLRNTEYQDFLDWITGETVNLNQSASFGESDLDHDGTLDRGEMEIAVKLYLEGPSIPLDDGNTHDDKEAAHVELVRVLHRPAQKKKPTALIESPQNIYKWAFR